MCGRLATLIAASPRAHDQWHLLNYLANPQSFPCIAIRELLVWGVFFAMRQHCRSASQERHSHMFHSTLGLTSKQFTCVLLYQGPALRWGRGGCPTFTSEIIRVTFSWLCACRNRSRRRQPSSHARSSASTLAHLRWAPTSQVPWVIVSGFACAVDRFADPLPNTPIQAKCKVSCGVVSRWKL